MDEIVKQAISKWPNVPDCFGWLGLDARGSWFMRDETTQSYGSFGSGTEFSKGSELKHEKLIDFIGRNYESDALGQWFFQNGPQRVYIELEATPLIWRIDSNFSICDHCGRPACMQNCLLDEFGRLYLETNTGFGLVHTYDTGHVAEALELGLWVLRNVQAANLPVQYGYVMSPQRIQNKSLQVV